ncbi:porin [Oceaniserpentilla sp. 4NH20-0058]|uniref:porin n=1 Tax=Oceaniserpentilla sp. 4NH20-0058 TaxID=3127660 RepID=UPI003102800C
MKKPLIAAAISMALAANAQAETQFYGKMNVSFNYLDTDPQFSIGSHASRLGVKGSEDLGTTKVIYQAEYETDIDGDGTVFKQRDSFVGLQYAGFGSIKMGIMDTPLKKSQGKFDLFNDVVDIKNVLGGEKRLGNSLNYTTEKFGALQASVSYVMMEDNTGVADDGISASLTFKQDNIYAAVAMDSKTEDADTSTIRGTVIVKSGDLTFGALVNNVDASDTTDDELGFAVNAAMKMGSNTAKVQFVSGDQQAAGATNISVGVDHKMAKTTKAYVYLNQFDSDASDQMAVTFGLEHKF